MAGTSDLDRQIEQLRRCEYIKEAEVKALCAKAREILVEESNVQRVDAPVTVRAVARERLAAEQERGARGRAEMAVKRPVRVSPLARSSFAVCGLRLLQGRDARAPHCTALRARSGGSCSCGTCRRAESRDVAPDLPAHLALFSLYQACATPSCGCRSAATSTASSTI